MTKEQWIELYAIQIMASYSAVQYDHNCYVGWREKEQFMCIEDAYNLAEKAWIRKIEFKK